MKIHWEKLLVCLLALSTVTTAQKVKVGYDKSTDFSKFNSYSWVEPAAPPARPFLYANIVGCVDEELKTKGLSRDTGNSDLLLVPAGGMEFGLNTASATPITPSFGGPPPVFDATMWTGAGGPNLTAIYVPEGTLMLTFIERATNKVVWTGTITGKLDVEHKMKSLERINKAIAKLLKHFPPQKK